MKRSISFILSAFFFALIATPILAAGIWQNVAELNTGRRSHSATLLNNGQVLVTGGDASIEQPLADSELYDVISNTWTTTGSMQEPRWDHTATLITTDTVMVIGGEAEPFGEPTYLRSAEIYNATTGTWVTTASMNVARSGHTSTMLPDGRLLIAGGWTLVFDEEIFFPEPEPTNSVEIYNYATQSWSSVTNMNEVRAQHTATLLNDGRVLVTGGYELKATAEIYDPILNTWSNTSNMSVRRGFHEASLLPSGEVMVSGGFGGPSANMLSSTEIYSPTLGIWAASASMLSHQGEIEMTQLDDGRIMVTGETTAEIFDNGTWSEAGEFDTSRSRHSATLLQNSQVLIAGGCASGFNGCQLARMSDNIKTATLFIDSSPTNIQMSSNSASPATTIGVLSILIATIAGSFVVISRGRNA